MNDSHRRPLFAYVLVTVAGAVIVAQGMAVTGFLPYFPGVPLERAGQDVVSRGQLLDESAVEPREGSGVAGEAGSGLRLVIDSNTFAAPAAPAAPEAPASAAPVPEPSGAIRSDLVGSTAAGPAGGGDQTGGKQGGAGGIAGDGPAFGGPPQAAPGADDDGTTGAGDGPQSSDGPEPHDVDHGAGGQGNHHGAAQPPRGPGNNNGHGHGADQDDPGRATGHDKPAKDKPGKDKPGKDKPGKDKPGKDKPGKDKKNG
ncbi:hypothetical protein GCM10009623_06670 [Nocardioides aestuarii]|uniref:hypothetical protein n=1 Tax=Nocardioides aestuarii TaxID=252231 RepID=UPI0031D5A40F